MIDLCQQISLPAPLRVLKSRGRGCSWKQQLVKPKGCMQCRWLFSHGNFQRARWRIKSKINLSPGVRGIRIPGKVHSTWVLLNNTNKINFCTSSCCWEWIGKPVYILSFIFFCKQKIWHSYDNLSPRYTWNLFYKMAQVRMVEWDN